MSLSKILYPLLSTGSSLEDRMLTFKYTSSLEALRCVLEQDTLSSAEYWYNFRSRKLS